MIIKNVVIEGIERVEGKRKTDGKPFGFWKLYGLGEYPFKSTSNQGQKAYIFNMSDKQYEESTVVLGSFVDLYVKGNDVCEFVCESA